MIRDVQVRFLAAYPTGVDRTYAVAATLLAVSAIVFSLTATAFGDDISNWFALYALTGVAMFVGLRIEPQQRALGVLLVVIPGVVISALTFWVFGIPILVLVSTCWMRVRRANRPT